MGFYRSWWAGRWAACQVAQQCWHGRGRFWAVESRVRCARGRAEQMLSFWTEGEGVDTCKNLQGHGRGASRGAGAGADGCRAHWADMVLLDLAQVLEAGLRLAVGGGPGVVGAGLVRALVGWEAVPWGPGWRNQRSNPSGRGAPMSPSSRTGGLVREPTISAQCQVHTHK